MDGNTMKKVCQNCKFFSGFNPLSTYMPHHGSCCNGKVEEESDKLRQQTDTAFGGGYEGYGDYLYVGKDFGCIHFSKKD